MSDTPETQKAVLDSDGQWSFVLKDCCERLERERDEARNELCDIRLNLGEDAEGYTLTHAVCVLQNERNEAMEDSLEQARLLGMGSEREAKLISERDEVRTDLEFRRGLYKVQEQYLDEAREKAERYRIEANAIMMQRDEWAAMCGRYKQERDEAREKYATEATEHMLAINKLFNERDEARNKIADALQEVESLEELKNIPQRTPETDDFELNLDEYSHPWKAIEFARKLERERDEVREQMKVIKRLEQERDEAMEALMKIEDLFIDGTDIYADKESMGLIAREALGETK